MLASPLHALARDRPGRCVHVELGPRCAPDLAGTRSRQNQEFERQPRRERSLRFPHRPDRVAGFGVMNGPEMPAPVADSRQRRRDGVAGRIVAAIPLRDCPLHDRADTLANAAGGHGFFSPYRQQDRHHVGRGDYIGLPARRGKAYCRSDAVHCPADFPPSRHVGLWISITVRAATSKIGMSDRRLSASGSPPARASLRPSKAAARASANETSGSLSANLTETPAPLGITVGRWR